MCSIVLWFILAVVSNVVKTNPVVLKESSSSGDTVIAISSSDPDTGKHVFIDHFPLIGKQSVQGPSNFPQDIFKKSFALVSPGNAIAGNGRSFVSTSSVNPFSFPMFFMPLHFGSIGNDWLRNIDNLYDPNLYGSGEVKTITAVNDNGHVYSKVRTVTFDDKGNRKTDVSSVSSNH